MRVLVEAGCLTAGDNASSAEEENPTWQVWRGKQMCQQAQGHVSEADVPYRITVHS